MTNSSLISIIIPTLNEAERIEAQLAGLQALGDDRIEIIVVDGGSRDDTPTLAAPLASHVISSNPGRAVQMNCAAQASQGDILLFLHADSRLPDGSIDEIQQALSDDYEWGRFNIRLQGHHPMLKVIALAMNVRSRLSGIATGDQALFMTRRAFEAVGGFPEQPLMEDIEISKRLKRLSRPACLRAHVVSSARRWERHGLWSTIWLMWCLRYRYWRGADSQQLAKEYRHAR
ncbi:glycosyl transferase family 2 [Litchfieldella qijiaojingensis]|uniref:Glycosyl transferase family 2 n=1 Tax=Litchfieldella qijiaojingensis TaxID=980347 RepID=A0ABQ2YLV5_9GAMM|nr:TIGR04283 family arsenosugar biosynthesis glycosyltransferase [Halomonas qijiaojingensis]GGX86553.1 glycosyl transferase family 2 [Halomonas qijiaojingensis]